MTLTGNRCKHPATLFGYCLAHFHKERKSKIRKDKMLKSKLHSVKVIPNSGKSYLFEVTSGSSKEKYDVAVGIGCTCKYSAVQGIPNKRLCSHSISVLKKMIKDAEVKR